MKKKHFSQTFKEGKAVPIHHAESSGEKYISWTCLGGKYISWTCLSGKYISWTCLGGKYICWAKLIPLGFLIACAPWLHFKIDKENCSRCMMMTLILMVTMPNDDDDCDFDDRDLGDGQWQSWKWRKSNLWLFEGGFSAVTFIASPYDASWRWWVFWGDCLQPI